MKLFLLASISILTISCMTPTNDDANSKQQIIKTLENETKYFCERDLAQWQVQWSHAPFVSKMYVGEIEFEEMNGWEVINQFTVQHIKEHPQPITIPKVHFEYDIHLFENTALVFYAKEVDGHVIKETRFMVKEAKEWKIARMQTIY